MNLGDLSDNQLRRLRSKIKAEFKSRRLKSDKELVREAEASGDDYLKALGQAILHRYHGIKPDRNLGLILARIPHSLKGLEPLYEKLTQRLDVVEYVFKTTDYDTCDNGRFYKRS